MSCGILVPQRGIEPGLSRVRAPSPNHWSRQKFPTYGFWIQAAGVDSLVVPYKLCDLEQVNFALPSLTVPSVKWE